MKQPIVKGHPLHAIFSDLPTAGFSLSYAFDILSRTVQGEPDGPSIDQIGGGLSHVVSGTTRLRTRFRDAANATYAGAFTGAAAAGLFGWWDFLNIPADHPARKPALIHGLLNSSVLLFAAGNLAARRQEPRWGGTSTLPFILSSIGFGGLLVSAWIGGDLVFRLGWRVKPAEELEIIEPELSKAGKDDIVRHARQQVDEYERGASLIA